MSPLSDVDLDKIESGGKVLGWIFVVLTAGFSLVWRVNRLGERIKELEDKVFPKEKNEKLLSYGWHEDLRKECDARREKDLVILAAHITEALRNDIGKLREDISALHERTKPRRLDDQPSP